MEADVPGTSEDHLRRKAMSTSPTVMAANSMFAFENLQEPSPDASGAKRSHSTGGASAGPPSPRPRPDAAAASVWDIPPNDSSDALLDDEVRSEISPPQRDHSKRAPHPQVLVRTSPPRVVAAGLVRTRYASSLNLLRAPAAQDDDDMDLALCLSHTGFAVPNSGFASAYEDDNAAASGGGGLDFAPRAASVSPQTRTNADEDDLMEAALGGGVHISRPLSVSGEEGQSLEAALAIEREDSSAALAKLEQFIRRKSQEKISELTVPGHRRTESPEERKARIEADDWSLDFAIACADGELFPDPDAEDARIGLRPSLSEDDKQVKL